MDARRRLSFLIFPQGDYWVAQCLEYDITTQAKSLRGMRKAVEYAIVGHIVVSMKIGVEPFESLPPAPKEFFDAFEEALPVPDMDTHRFPLRTPPDVLPMFTPQERDFRVGDLARAMV